MAAVINPAAINAYAQAAKMGGAGGGEAAAATPGASFGDMLSNVLGEISSDVERVVLSFVVKTLSAFNTTIRDTGVPMWTALERSLGALQVIDP